MGALILAAALPTQLERQPRGEQELGHARPLHIGKTSAAAGAEDASRGIYQCEHEPRFGSDRYTFGHERLCAKILCAGNLELAGPDVECAAKLTTAERSDFDLLCVYGTWDRKPNRNDKSHVTQVRVFRKQRTLRL